MADHLPTWLVLLTVIVGAAGAAGIGGVITTYLKDRRVAATDERSVTIVEVEKAIPGLGEIIQQLRTQNTAQAVEIDRLHRENGRLSREVSNLKNRVGELERDLGIGGIG